MEHTVTYDRYLDRVHYQGLRNPNWRVGQTYFNVLSEVHPALAERVRGTLVDPFYSDSVVPEFLSHVQGLWEDV